MLVLDQWWPQAEIVIHDANKSIRDAVATQDPAQIQSAFDAHRYFANSFWRDLATFALHYTRSKQIQRKVLLPSCISLLRQGTLDARYYFKDDEHTHTVLNLYTKEAPLCRKYSFRHAFAGYIEYWENHGYNRREFAKGHPQHGAIDYLDFLKDGIIRREWKKDHPNYGIIQYFKYKEPIRTEYANDHKWHGQIRYIKNKQCVRLEFAKDHEHHGAIRYYENGKCVRIEYAEGHKDYGAIHYFDNDSKRKVEERKVAEEERQFAEQERKEQECKRKAIERQVEEYFERKAAERKAAERKAAERKAAERKAIADRKTAERKAIADRKTTERKAAERKAAERTAIADRKAAERTATADCQAEESTVVQPNEYKYFPSYDTSSKKRTPMEEAELKRKRQSKRSGQLATISEIDFPSSSCKYTKIKESKTSSTPTKKSEKSVCMDIISKEQRRHQQSCPSCKNLVTRASDLNNHVNCSTCGTEFCFLCLTRLQGTKEYGTKKLHFGLTCKQHGDRVCAPTRAGLSAYFQQCTAQSAESSCLAMSVATEDVPLAPFSPHALERQDYRDRSYFACQKVKKYANEEETCNAHGNPSTCYRYKTPQGTHKIWENSSGSRTTSVA